MSLLTAIATDTFLVTLVALFLGTAVLIAMTVMTLGRRRAIGVLAIWSVFIVCAVVFALWANTR